MGKESEIEINMTATDANVANTALLASTISNDLSRLENINDFVPSYWKGVGASSFTEALGTLIGDVNAYNETNGDFIQGSRNIISDYYQVQDDALDQLINMEATKKNSELARARRNS